MGKQKIVTVGPASIGKTSLINALCDREFNEDQMPTIAQEFISQEVMFEGHTFTNEYWDTAGQERFSHLNGYYIHGANIVLALCYANDLSSLESSLSVVNNTIGSNEYELIIVFSKWDIESVDDVTLRKAINDVKIYNPRDVIPTSSKIHYNIEELKTIISSCYHESTVSEHPVLKTQSSCC
ncbi:small GTP-binding protein, putative [Trichomonas vaginalis G3]|uniref:Small GTP-binding protein, putative n=2 Tax=Trichomonas vaginalis TaxID=5722 RepID=A0A8U0WPA1_TRIV3|nr:small Rab GTPase RabX6 [Trichomonas vaginalis G3]AAX97484.1 small Rab GTPase RabX6 [Trichomonas vaginalis]EAX88922.1 small GTP-binding protein, putative [Trichomonas vaginalis G3]KAI5512491.1 small Rab GTPase RabX6 [Trichomonas vaginalis G3]|eukprot:XP_001301852.1 small GTP-binding protein [Trichomonas vaginalis G3]